MNESGRNSATGTAEILANESARNSVNESVKVSDTYWDDWRVCNLRWMTVNEDRRTREKAEQKTKKTRRMKMPD